MRTIRRQAKATSLDHAIELAKRHAKEQHRPSKVMADLMGVELKTYYRWLLDNTLPLNRIAQFEALTGSRFISEYLSVLHGDRVVIEIPRGRKGKAADVYANDLEFTPHPDTARLDWMIAFGLPQNRRRWFCSEWCATALRLPESWRWSPNDLAAIMPALKRQA